MEFLKDYDFGLNYNPRKANVVADPLSRKSLYASWTMVKEAKLVKSFKDLSLGFTLTPSSIRLNHVVVIINFKGRIVLAQSTKPEFLETLTLVEQGKLKDFAKGLDGL